MLYRVILKHQICKSSKLHRNILQSLLVVEKASKSGHLQEVFASSTSSSRNSALILRNGTEDAELGVQILTDVHDGSNIATAVAVVGSGPDGDNGLVSKVVLENQ